MVRILAASTKDRREIPHGDRKKGSIMKRITLAAIAATALVILYAGKDDIRRFRRMHSM
jgi:hypothetical protein